MAASFIHLSEISEALGLGSSVKIPLWKKPFWRNPLSTWEKPQESLRSAAYWNGIKLHSADQTRLVLQRALGMTEELKAGVAFGALRYCGKTWRRELEGRAGLGLEGRWLSARQFCADTAAAFRSAIYVTKPAARPV